MPDSPTHVPTSSLIMDAQMRLAEDEQFTNAIVMSAEALNEVDFLQQRIKKLEQLDTDLSAFADERVDLNDEHGAFSDAIHEEIADLRAKLDMTVRWLLDSMMPD